MQRQLDKSDNFFSLLDLPIEVLLIITNLLDNKSFARLAMVNRGLKESLMDEVDKRIFPQESAIISAENVLALIEKGRAQVKIRSSTILASDNCWKNNDWINWLQTLSSTDSIRGTPTTLIPADGRANLSTAVKVNHGIAVLFALDKLTFKKEILKGKKQTSNTPEANTSCLTTVRTTISKGQIQAIICPVDDRISRLNALTKKYLTYSFLQVELPILIITANQKPSEYTISAQVKDIEFIINKVATNSIHKHLLDDLFLINNTNGIDVYRGAKSYEELLQALLTSGSIFNIFPTLTNMHWQHVARYFPALSKTIIKAARKQAENNTPFSEKNCQCLSLLTAFSNKKAKDKLQQSILATLKKMIDLDTAFNLLKQIDIKTWDQIFSITIKYKDFDLATVLLDNLPRFLAPNMFIVFFKTAIDNNEIIFAAELLTNKKFNFIGEEKKFEAAIYALKHDQSNMVLHGLRINTIKKIPDLALFAVLYDQQKLVHKIDPKFEFNHDSKQPLTANFVAFATKHASTINPATWPLVLVEFIKLTEDVETVHRLFQKQKQPYGCLAFLETLKFAGIETLLSMAIQYQHAGLVFLLITKGANINQKQDNNTLLKQILESKQLRLLAYVLLHEKQSELSAESLQQALITTVITPSNKNTRFANLIIDIAKKRDIRFHHEVLHTAIYHRNIQAINMLCEFDSRLIISEMVEEQNGLQLALVELEKHPDQEKVFLNIINIFLTHLLSSQNASRHIPSFFKKLVEKHRSDLVLQFIQDHSEALKPIIKGSFIIRDILWTALDEDNIALISLMIQHGANIDITRKDINYFQALFEKGYKTIVINLLNDMEPKNTALIKKIFLYTVQQQDESLALAILAIAKKFPLISPHPTSTTSRHTNSLHLAIQHGFCQLTQALLDPHFTTYFYATNDEGKTPLDLAWERVREKESKQNLAILIALLQKIKLSDFCENMPQEYPDSLRAYNRNTALPEMFTVLIKHEQYDLVLALLKEFKPLQLDTKYLLNFLNFALDKVYGEKENTDNALLKFFEKLLIEADFISSEQLIDLLAQLSNNGNGEIVYRILAAKPDFKLDGNTLILTQALDKQQYQLAALTIARNACLTTIKNANCLNDLFQFLLEYTCTIPFSSCHVLQRLLTEIECPREKYMTIFKMLLEQGKADIVFDILKINQRIDLGNDRTLLYSVLNQPAPLLPLAVQLIKHGANIYEATTRFISIIAKENKLKNDDLIVFYTAIITHPKLDTQELLALIFHLCKLNQTEYALMALNIAASRKIDVSQCHDTDKQKHALHYAAQHANTELIKAFKGISPRDQEGNTPLDIAIEEFMKNPRKFQPTIRALLLITKNISHDEILRAFSAFLQQNREVSLNFLMRYHHEELQLPLKLATFKTIIALAEANPDYQQAVDKIVRFHFERNKDNRDLNDLPIIMLWLYQNKQKDYATLALNLAIKHNVDISDCHDINTGNHALHYAAMDHDMLFITLLIKACKVITPTNNENQTPLDIVISQCTQNPKPYLAVMIVLLENNLDITHEKILPAFSLIYSNQSYQEKFKYLLELFQEKLSLSAISNITQLAIANPAYIPVVEQIINFHHQQAATLVRDKIYAMTSWKNLITYQQTLLDLLPLNKEKHEYNKTEALIFKKIIAIIELRESIENAKSINSIVKDGLGKSTLAQTLNQHTSAVTFFGTRETKSGSLLTELKVQFIKEIMENTTIIESQKILKTASATLESAKQPALTEDQPSPGLQQK